MEDLSFIEVVFENCESIIIPKNRIKKLDFGDIAAIDDFPFDDFTAYRSEHLYLDISYESDFDLVYDFEEYSEPLGMFADNPTSNSVEDRPSILGRINNYNDITSIEILDSNKAGNKIIYVPWNEDDQYTNKYMTVDTKDGVLSIRIKNQFD